MAGHYGVHPEGCLEISVNSMGLQTSVRRGSDSTVKRPLQAGVKLWAELKVAKSGYRKLGQHRKALHHVETRRP